MCSPAGWPTRSPPSPKQPRPRPTWPGRVALACLSTAAGGKVLVRVDRSWLEQVNLYTAIALPPGSRKSPVFRAMTGALNAAEAALQEATAEQRIEAELAARIAHARAEEARQEGRGLHRQPAGCAGRRDRRREGSRRDRRTGSTPADDRRRDAGSVRVADGRTRRPDRCAVGRRRRVLHPHRHPLLRSTEPCCVPQSPRRRPDPSRPQRPRVRSDRAARHDARSHHPTRHPQGLASQPGFRDRGVLGRILYSLPVNTVGKRNNTPTPSPNRPKPPTATPCEPSSCSWPTTTPHTTSNSPPKPDKSSSTSKTGSNPDSTPDRATRTHHRLGLQTRRSRRPDRRPAPPRPHLHHRLRQPHHRRHHARRRTHRPLLPRPRPSRLRPHGPIPPRPRRRPRSPRPGSPSTATEPAATPSLAATRYAACKEQPIPNRRRPRTRPQAPHRTRPHPAQAAEKSTKGGRPSHTYEVHPHVLKTP